MAATLQADYGNRLLGSDCLDPRTRDLKFGTNLYYNDYCANLLQLNTIRHTSSATPYFESLLYNQGIIFKSAQYPNLSAQILTDGNEIEIFTKSNNPYFYSLLQTTNQASSLTVAGPLKTIELNTSDLISNLGTVKMRNIGLNGENFYILTNGGRGSQVDINVRNAVRSQYSEQANSAYESLYADTSSYAIQAREASYAVNSRNSYISDLAETALFSYAAETSITAYSSTNATTAAYALAFDGGAGIIKNAAYAGTATDARFAAYAGNAGNSAYAGTATDAQFAAYTDKVGNAAYAGTATDARFAAYAGNAGNSAYAGTATDAQFATQATNATNADNSAYAGTATDARFAAYAGDAGKSAYAGTATDARFAAYADKSGSGGGGIPPGYSELSIIVCVNGVNTSRTFLVK